MREFINGEQERYLTTQHERDQETDLDYRGARYYDGDIGRFLSLDPHAANYPSFSDYSYVANNPIIFIDPDGKDVRDAEGNIISEDQETGWTENHLYLNSVFGDPAGFNEMIAPAVFQKKPSWDDMYNNYPKNPSDPSQELSSPEVYKMVFGDSYDPATKMLNFGNLQINAANSCALRVALALVRCGIKLPSDFRGSEGEFKGKGVVLSSVRLKKHLTNTVFGQPTEQFDMSKYTVDQVRNALSGRKGIYIMTPRPGEFSTAVGHCTLWTGGNTSKDDVIGGHSYIENASHVYFWELK